MLALNVNKSINRNRASKAVMNKKEFFLWKNAVIGENIKTTKQIETSHNGHKRNSDVGCKLSFTVTKYSGINLFRLYTFWSSNCEAE